MNIIYVASLIHSGSTILDMGLGCNKKIVGLGEVTIFIKAKKPELSTNPYFNELKCSCGSEINNCSFWKGAKSLMIEHENVSSVEKYIKLAEYFAEMYGSDVILLDSSKQPEEHLVELQKKFNLKVIFLVRDVRGWCYSRNSLHGANIFQLARRWYKGNKKIQKFLERNKISYMHLGYEELALYPELMLRRICDFVGVEFDERMLVPDNSESHVFKGNVAKGDKNKRKGFFYDARWLTSASLNFYFTLCFPLLWYNRKLVYSNFVGLKPDTRDSTQQDFLIFGDARRKEMIEGGWGRKKK